MPTPAFTQNQRKNSGIYIGPTVGKSSPKNSRRGCLCLKDNTYSTKCCKGYLQNQGIGRISGVVTPSVTEGAFSAGFSAGFDIGNI
jgi:hypothetical protein